MAEDDKAASAPETAQPQQPETAQSAPFLPASFFSQLVRQPSCVTKGVCDNCGRCEH